MSSYPNKLPAWLGNAYTESHISLALATLAERENIRSISRRGPRKLSTSPSSSPRSSPTRNKIPQAYYDYYSVTTANNKQNSHSNRYLDIVPYDRTRVVVANGNSVGRYLNANWVLERYGHKWWIATQAPLPTTAHAFLSLILQPIPKPPNTPSSPPTSQEDVEMSASSYESSRIRTVVQLTKNMERTRIKAHPYFPTEVGKSLIVSPDPGLSAPALKVTLLQTHDHEDAQCIRSTIAITPVSSTSTVQDSAQIHSRGDEGESADVYGRKDCEDKVVIFQHLLYTAWPDHGVPEDKDRTSLLAFLKLVDRVNRDICNYPPMSPNANQKQYDPDPPVIVGCSAGVGRTGSFIALSSLLRHSGFLLPAANPTAASVIPPSPLGSLPDALVGDLVVEEIDFLREQRPRMVERPEQTLLVYELLIDAFQKHENL